MAKLEDSEESAAEDYYAVQEPQELVSASPGNTDYMPSENDRDSIAVAHVRVRDVPPSEPGRDPASRTVSTSLFSTTSSQDQLNEQWRVPPDAMDSKGDNIKQRRKATQPCIPCRRAHTKCDLERPCKRCVRRDIGHLCHDEPRDPPTKEKSEAEMAGPALKLNPQESSIEAQPGRGMEWHHQQSPGEVFKNSKPVRPRKPFFPWKYTDALTRLGTPI